MKHPLGFNSVIKNFQSYNEIILKKLYTMAPISFNENK